ncbi:MAG TPA: error-prone DNA polymerase [Gammaproteobacteria bacterium]|nr:error-prone DNA polymerase [Gammaproteobacteria bacterium]
MTRNPSAPGYAELHCLSNFSFLRGASHPEELALMAAKLGYAAIAVTDECSLAGVVRAHLAAKAGGIPLIVGSEMKLGDGPKLVLLATDRAAYGRLSGLITQGRRAAGKGGYHLGLEDLDNGLEGCLALLIPEKEKRGQKRGQSPFSSTDVADSKRSCSKKVSDPFFARWLEERFPERAWIAFERHLDAGDTYRLQKLKSLSAQSGLPLVAAGDVHMHMRARQPLQDTLTAIRSGMKVAEAGFELFPNAERHLRSREKLARLYPRALLEETLAVAARCRFSLDELRYEYPEEIVPAGRTPAGHLRQLVESGIDRRFPRGASEKVRVLVERELELIAELCYEPYFLTVYDIVRFARERGILCQGRGSAANSAVCYCLGITEVDPARMEMLFERFISRERNEPPDIDVDFEHERREEVIQYIYEKYGRDRAAIAATVIRYQPRSAVRDVGKALGLAPAQVDRLAKSLAWWDGKRVLKARFEEAGLDPASPVMDRLARLVDTLIGFPRHLSQHTGGFVIARGRLSDLVPVENAAMPERTVIQWDKDDLDALGLLKVDVLALGMLTAIRRSFDLIEAYRGTALSMASVPAEDPAVYEMIGHADTVGVFQIESRAQMAMLPRMKPKCYYDLVIEVAIVRPGPIQGGMVHPYLRRRQGLEPVSYPSDAVRGVLERTLGVPIFQEQAMQLAVVAAGFTPGEADQLRRAMAAWRRRGGLGPFEARLIDGMRARGYSEAFARQIFRQIEGFGDYGFPESHSASFALLVYVSAWLKCHHPAAFTCALLNSQPMGFYAPAQLINDARRHGVAVRSVDVNASAYDCTLERGKRGAPAVRLGFRMVKGLAEESAERIVSARSGNAGKRGRTPFSNVSSSSVQQGKTKKGADSFSKEPFHSVEDLARRAKLSRSEMKLLAQAGALAGIAGHRHKAAWKVAGVEAPTPLMRQPRVAEGTPLLRSPSEGEDLIADYQTLGLTLGRHPLALLRKYFDRMRLCTASDIRVTNQGTFARAAGLVINRQRPSTASGVIFVTLEDETGQINLVVWPWVAERQRRVVLHARLLVASGTVERDGEVVHLIAGRLEDYSRLLGKLETRSRDFQ